MGRGTSQVAPRPVQVSCANLGSLQSWQTAAAARTLQPLWTKEPGSPNIPICRGALVVFRSISSTRGWLPAFLPSFLCCSGQGCHEEGQSCSCCSSAWVMALAEPSWVLPFVKKRAEGLLESQFALSCLREGMGRARGARSRDGTGGSGSRGRARGTAASAA